MADDPDLARIAASEQWPTIYAFDEQGLEQRAIRDKAHAQGAAFLMDMPASDGRSWLEIVWAVFLPTGDESAEALVIEGAIADRSFRLVLHGYFSSTLGGR
jgi:hypothetical protein